MDNTAIEVLKWIGIVFAAGFVGYFGRHLAMILIERMRRNKPESPAPEAPPTTHPPPSDIAAAQAKVEKKRAKAETKRAKKEKG